MGLLFQMTEKGDLLTVGRSPVGSENHAQFRHVLSW